MGENMQEEELFAEKCFIMKQEHKYVQLLEKVRLWTTSVWLQKVLKAEMLISDQPVIFQIDCGERERNVLFNDTLNTFYLRLYGVRHG